MKDSSKKLRTRFFGTVFATMIKRIQKLKPPNAFIKICDHFHFLSSFILGLHYKLRKKKHFFLANEGQLQKTWDKFLWNRIRSDDKTHTKIKTS